MPLWGVRHRATHVGREEHPAHAATDESPMGAKIGRGLAPSERPNTKAKRFVTPAAKDGSRRAADSQSAVTDTDPRPDEQCLRTTAVRQTISRFRAPKTLRWSDLQNVHEPRDHIRTGYVFCRGTRRGSDLRGAACSRSDGVSPAARNQQAASRYPRPAKSRAGNSRLEAFGAALDFLIVAWLVFWFSKKVLKEVSITKE